MRCNEKSYTRAVSIGCAVVDDANSSCCKLWIRVHLTDDQTEKQKISEAYKKLKVFAQYYY